MSDGSSSAWRAAAATAPGEMPPRWRVWWLAARPKTLAASVVPVLVGTSFAVANAAEHWWAALIALLGAIGIQIGTNLHNDLADFEKGADTGERLGPARATQRGWLQVHQVRRGVWLAFGVAVACGVYLVARGGWPVVALGLASLAAGLAYTSGPFPLAYLGLADIFVLVFFGLGAVAGTYYVQTLSLSIPVLAGGVAVGALSTAILAVNNLRDRHTDAAAGKRTLAVRLGATACRWEYTLAVAVAFAIPAWIALRAHPGAALAWVSAPLAIRAVAHVWRRDGRALNPVLGETARTLTLFGVAFAVGVAW